MTLTRCGLWMVITLTGATGCTQVSQPHQVVAAGECGAETLAGISISQRTACAPLEIHNVSK